MRFIVGDSVAKAAAQGAEAVAAWSREAIAERGTFTVALTGGESPKALYEALRARRDIEWRRWEVFFGDERAVSSQDPRSNLLAAEELLLNRVAVNPDRVHAMYALGMDIEQAALDYEAALRTTVGDPPVFDLVMLGVGRDGHTLSLPPYCGAIAERQRLVMALVDPEMDPAVDRITFTPPVVRAARRVLVIAHGRAKAPAMKAALDDADDRQRVPAQLIRDATGEVTVLMDEELARSLGRSER
jgi:6-phosphogluconolactonase